MGKRVGSPADRMFVYEQIEAHHGQAGHELCERLREALHVAISDRSLRQWHRDVKQAIRKAKRDEKAELNGNLVALPRSTEIDTQSTPDAPQIDLSGKSRLEILDLAIDRRLAKLAQAVQETGDSSLSKQVSELMEARRRELGIPQPVMDALGPLGRLHGLIQHLVADETLEPETTLRIVIENTCDAWEKHVARLESGEQSHVDTGRSVRSPEWSNHTIGELLEELLAVPVLWNEWIQINSYMQSCIGEAVGRTPLKSWFEVPRDIRDAMPELRELWMAISSRTSFDYRPAFLALAKYVKAHGVPGLPRVEPDAETDPIVSVRAVPVPENKEVEFVSAQTADPEDLPDSEAVILAEGVLGSLAQQEMQIEIARMKRTGEWWTLQGAQRRALNDQAGYDTMTDVER